MDLKKYLAAVQAQEYRLQDPNCDKTKTMLEILHDAYYEHICVDDTQEIKQAFAALYESMTGKTLQEKDEIIDAVCHLCRVHQQTGFVDGVQWCFCVKEEVSR